VVKKTLTVRLAESLVAQIDAESRRRNVTKSDVVRERLERYGEPPAEDPLASIRDLIGSIDQGPPDLSARKKHYLKVTGFGRKRPR
jgi:hypothetical protein